MEVIFASLRLSEKLPVSMDLFIKLANMSNANSLCVNILIGILLPTDSLFFMSQIIALTSTIKTG